MCLLHVKVMRHRSDLVEDKLKGLLGEANGFMSPTKTKKRGLNSPDFLTANEETLLIFMLL